MKAWDIVGYTYKAEAWHPKCLIEGLIAYGQAAPAARDMYVEDVLEQIREVNAYDDVELADSGIFPQPVFASDWFDSTVEDLVCNECLTSLEDQA